MEYGITEYRIKFNTLFNTHNKFRLETCLKPRHIAGYTFTFKGMPLLHVKTEAATLPYR